MVHLADVVKEGHKNILIRTVDTDVVALAISCMQTTSADQIWVAFGSGKNFRYISIDQLSKELKSSRSYVLPAFPAVTGYDTESSFGGKGKKTAWDVI